MPTAEFSKMARQRLFARPQGLLCPYASAISACNSLLVLGGWRALADGHLQLVSNSADCTLRVLLLGNDQLINRADKLKMTNRGTCPTSKDHE